MAKIGTAHVEIKPVLNEDALAAIVARIEAALPPGVANPTKGAAFGTDGQRLQPGDGPFYLPDAEGTVREFRVGSASLTYRDGDPLTTYTLIRPHHFAEGPGEQS